MKRMDEGEVDRSDRVDLPFIQQEAQTLDMVGDDLKELADILDARSDEDKDPF